MSLKLSVENILIAQIAGQATLPVGFTVTNFDSDTHQNKDRIFVKATPNPEESLKNGGGRTIAVWCFDVELSVLMATKSTSTLDTLVGVIDSAVKGPAIAAAVTLATSAFPNGFQIRDGSAVVEHDPEKRTHKLSIKVDARE
jgi:hypothetical protein